VSAVEQNKQEAENISGNSSKPSELECAAHLVSAKKKKSAKVKFAQQFGRTGTYLPK
jgi:hypothetical protein